jgi:RNA polymerase sigma factor (sigma-70 family)
VPAAQDWVAIVAVLRRADDPSTSPELPRLYELALADGPPLLRSFRRRLGDDRIVDLIHDLLAAKLDALVAADEPRALFCTALQRRAISWLRRGDADVVEDAREAVGETDESERQQFIVDARSALDHLPERERAIVVAVALGEEREAVARAFGTSRANVDQIVSRVRRRFSAEAP